MKYTELYKSIKTQLQNNTKHVNHYITGAPGGGKSALAQQLGADPELNYATTTQFFASLREPIDLMGLPRFDETTDTVRWRIPNELKHLHNSNNTNGNNQRHLLILEELSDANTAMQNALCGLIYDRKCGELHLSSNVDIIATGNRTKDKSGANRLVSKLVGRLRVLDFHENLDDWVKWAQEVTTEVETETLQTRITPNLISFLRFRPDLLSAFNPDGPSPTPRTWERVDQTPMSLHATNKSIYLNTIAGDVGTGAASEYVAFLDVYKDLPDINQIIQNPDTTPVPAELSSKYALVGALTHRTKKTNFAKILIYINRLPKDFGVLYVKDSMKLTPSIISTDAFLSWSKENMEVLGLR